MPDFDHRSVPVLLVHGVGQQHSGARLLMRAWLPALRDGLERARHPDPDEVGAACAFYGDCFRLAGTKSAALDPPYGADDVRPGLETDILLHWWARAAAVEPDRVSGPLGDTKGRAPAVAVSALRALGNSRFWSGVSRRAMVASLKQVAAYLDEDSVRASVQARIGAAVTAATRVLVGHSLGSVAAYEAACAHPEWGLDTLVTIGSPLGLRQLVLARLQPPPSGGRGQWPHVRRWVNVADAGDIVAAEPRLHGLFAGRIEDHEVHNGAHAHALEPYLTSRVVGAAIAGGLGR